MPRKRKPASEVSATRSRVALEGWKKLGPRQRRKRIAAALQARTAAKQPG